MCEEILKGILVLQAATRDHTAGVTGQTKDVRGIIFYKVAPARQRVRQAIIFSQHISLFHGCVIFPPYRPSEGGCIPYIIFNFSFLLLFSSFWRWYLRVTLSFNGLHIKERIKHFFSICIMYVLYISMHVLQTKTK